MKKRSQVIYYFALIIISFSCLSWGKYGHQLVGDIAKVYVSKSVLDSVQKYLGDMSWADASTWMDEIRSNNYYDYLKPMHYINIDEGNSYIKTNDDNIINELDKIIDELKNRKDLSNEKVNQDLKILFHLMGDLHQPLHVGYGIDKGGNTIDVDFFGESTNLHKVWDTEMIQHDKTFKNELIEMSKHITNSEIQKLQKVDVLAWMNESRSYLSQVYDFQQGKIDENYIRKNIPVAEKQILYAGIRLAGVLNSIFGQLPNDTTSNSKELIEPPQLMLNEENNESKIAPSNTTKYQEGKIETVCDKVTGTHVGKTGVMMLNFGGKYPNNTFTAVVFADDASKFKKAEYYDGKQICVTGKIKMYQGKPEILLKEASQLKEQ